MNWKRYGRFDVVMALHMTLIVALIWLFRWLMPAASNSHVLQWTTLVFLVAWRASWESEGR